MSIWPVWATALVARTTAVAVFGGAIATAAVLAIAFLLDRADRERLDEVARFAAIGDVAAGLSETKPENVLFGDAAAVANVHAVADIAKPGAQWQLAASPRLQANSRGRAALANPWIGAGLLALLGGFAVWWLVRDRARLRRRIAIVTAEVRALSNNLLATQKNMAQGIQVFDRDGRLTSANSRFMTLLDLPDRLAQPGTPIAEILMFRAQRGDFGSGRPAELVRRRMDLVGCGKPFTAEEVQPSGTATLIEGKPMPSGGLVVTCTDISESKRAEAELRRARDELEKRVAERTDELARTYGKMVCEVREHRRTEGELRKAKEIAELASRSKTEFLANVSHELRTPLNAMIGFSDLIQKEAHGPVGAHKYLEYADAINQSSQHLLVTINDLLDLSKIAAGTQKLRESVVDVADVIQTCRKFLHSRAEEGSVRIRIQPAIQPVRLRADRRLLTQILLNLMSNAVKFTRPGGRITVGTALAPDGSATIRVSDTGIGIKVQDMERIMVPFQQIDGSTARRHAGTGLGLSLAKGMTELHGGTLDLQSEFGSGTVVTLSFPAGRVVLMRHNGG